MAVLALDCGSCVNIDRRDAPKDWPAVPISAQGCPDLTGSYVNSDQGTPAVSVAKWILPKTTYPLERIERVYLAGPTNRTLSVRLMEGPHMEIAVRELKQDAEYRCENGWLVLPLEGFFAPFPAVAYSREARLARTIDGQLVVEATETTGGVVGFVPGYASKRNWHLYPLAAE